MKKKVVSFLAFVLVAGVATAQTESGNWLIGGDLELNTSKNNTVVNISPMAGYFFANNFAGGGNLTFDLTKFGDAKVTTFGIGPFLRYYFGTTNIKPLVHGSFDYTSTKAEDETFNGMNYFLAGGLAAFINRNVAIEGLAGYSHTKIRHSGEDAGSGGFRLKIGFQVYLSGMQMAKATGQ